MPSNPETVPDALRRVGVIINRLSSWLRPHFGGLLPDDYLTYDVETSGFNRTKDLILEWGHVLVNARQPVSRLSMYLNWYDSPNIPHDWLDARLERIRFEMQSCGRSWHITPELLKEKGVNPKEAVQWIFDFLTELKASKTVLIGHNAGAFDVQMLQSHFKQDLNQEFLFPADGIFDTGVIEKASQMGDDARLLPLSGESVVAYIKRITYIKAPGVKWNLDPHCVVKYGVDTSHGIGTADMHGAGTDAYVVHVLVEKFRALAEAEAARKPPAPVTTRAARTAPPPATPTPRIVIPDNNAIPAAAAMRKELAAHIDEYYDGPKQKPAPVQNFRKQRNR